MATLYFWYSLAGLGVAAALIAALIRRPSAGLAFFTAFFAMSLIDFLIAFVTHASGRNGFPSFFVQAFWMPALAIARLRFALLILYAHSFRRYRLTRFLSAALVSAVCVSAASTLIAYTPFPELLETAVILYIACYLATLLPRSGKADAVESDLPTVKAIVSCTAFFFIGILVDLMKSVPPTSQYVSMFILDFNPVYVLCLGGFIAYRSLAIAPHPASAPSQRPSAFADDSFIGLSRREREVIGLILEGETNRGIADRLFISESTVKKHVNRIFKKLNVDNRWNLLKIARKNERIRL